MRIPIKRLTLFSYASPTNTTNILLLSLARGWVKREYYTIAAAAAAATTFEPRQVSRRCRGRFMVLDYTSCIYRA